jgi:hypothetical protein
MLVLVVILERGCHGCFANADYYRFIHLLSCYSLVMLVVVSATFPFYLMAIDTRWLVGDVLHAYSTYIGRI